MRHILFCGRKWIDSQLFIMPSRLSAVELIKRYQQLFANLDHCQIAQRLAGFIAERSAVKRVAFMLARDADISVEVVAQGERVDTLGAPLARMPGFAFERICEAFSERHSVYFRRANRDICIRPICEGDEVIACFYIESEAGPEELAQVESELEPLWAFSSLLVRQLVDRRRFEQQTDKLKATEQALWASDAYLTGILGHSPVLISVKDLDGNVVLASDHYKHLAEVGEEGFVGKNVFDAYPKELAEKLWQSDMAAGREQLSIEQEIPIHHKDGTLHTYLMLKFPLRDRDKRVFGVCTICTDITERKMAEDALREQQSRLNYMAFHDSLTALPNRSLFYDRIYQSLARAKRGELQFALMLLDLDRFKTINDTLGHDAGDLLLKATAQRLLDCVRDTDTVARLGGDEFVIILENIQNEAEVQPIAEKILQSLAEPLRVSGMELNTSASIGISLFPEAGTDTDSLLKHADIAMYKAKEAGKNTYQFYRSGMNASGMNFLLLENELRKALEAEQLELFFQPQVDMRTRKLIGAEVLVRWRHPERGLISPAHFIPLAEETGLIVPMSEWLLRKASRQQKLWQLAGILVPKLAVNLSPRQFRQKGFPEAVADLLAQESLCHSALELEITETSAMEHASNTIMQLTQLEQMGLSLAIDDFGTGYSSLAYLKRFPINKLKIDQGFIHDIDDPEGDPAIAKSIIDLAHNMGLQVIAEGVETLEQAQWLKAQGCDQAQGYYFAKPMAAAEFEVWLADYELRQAPRFQTFEQIA